MADALMTVSVALAGLNTLLALVLGAVYLRNHAQLKSPFTLGLLVFSAFLVLHNGMAVWHWFTMMSVPGVDANFVLLENVLQAGALVALVAATLR